MGHSMSLIVNDVEIKLFAIYDGKMMHDTMIEANYGGRKNENKRRIILRQKPLSTRLGIRRINSIYNNGGLR